MSKDSLGIARRITRDLEQQSTPAPRFDGRGALGGWLEPTSRLRVSSAPFSTTAAMEALANRV
jgi:hypothetical protein